MNVLPVGAEAPDFEATTRSGETISLRGALKGAPVVLCFAMPQVFSSRLVVGYLRRLKENVPEVPIWIILQGEANEVARYSQGYLDALDVIHDRDLRLSTLYGVTHVASTYYLTWDQDEVAKVSLSFTGFSRPALNKLAALAAEATGAKVKELITPLDNKGEYELAEKALSAEVNAAR